MTHRTAILADIHGNLEALEAVLRDIDTVKPDRIVALGDNIGYGPNPRECLERVSGIADFMLIGNHEKDAIEPENGMCADAQEVLDWTVQQVEDLPAWQTIQDYVTKQGFEGLATKKEKGREYVHGSPSKPVYQYLWPGHESHYIVFNDQIDERLKEFMDEFTEEHGFCAHTHTPAILTAYQHRKIFDERPNWNRRDTFIGPNTLFFVPEGNVTIKGIAGKKVVINPGSVGQPRDGNLNASYGLYDGDTLHIRRVPYDVGKTQKKILEMPVRKETREYFAERLAKGE